MPFVKLSLALSYPVTRTPRHPRREVTIYAISDPMDGCVRYVGKTKKSLAIRLAEHINNPVSMAMAFWLARLHTNGRSATITMLEICPEERWELAEQFWIRWFRHRGELLNVDPGGVYRDAKGALLPNRARTQNKKKVKATYKQWERQKERLEVIQKSGVVKVFTREEIAATYGSR